MKVSWMNSSVGDAFNPIKSLNSLFGNNSGLGRIYHFKNKNVILSVANIDLNGVGGPLQTMLKLGKWENLHIFTSLCTFPSLLQFFFSFSSLQSSRGKDVTKSFNYHIFIQISEMSTLEICKYIFFLWNINIIFFKGKVEKGWKKEKVKIESEAKILADVLCNMY